MDLLHALTAVPDEDDFDVQEVTNDGTELL